MSVLYVTLVLGLACSVNLINARSDTRMRREDGIHCYQEGVNENPDKSDQFTICAKDGDGKFVGATYSCSKGEEFDRNTMSCAKMLGVRRMLRNAVPLGCDRKQCHGEGNGEGDSNEGDGTTPIPEEKDCKNRTLQCLEDCHTLRLCYEVGGAYQHLDDVPCKDGDYCDDSTASCTTKVPSTCPAKFNCMGSGYYPDPSDCTRYYICYASGSNLLASAQYCAANQVYSTSKKMCVTKVKVSDCQQVKCPAGVVQYAVFPGDASYYVICMNGKPEFVLHCGESKEFNLDTNSCQVTCKSAGRMPDPDNCNQFYECTAGWLGNKFTLTSHTCPPGLGFNKVTLLCDGETTCA